MSNLLNNGEMQVQALINAANQQAVNNQADNAVSDAEMSALQKKIQQQVELKNAQLKHSLAEQEQFSKQQGAAFDKALRGGLGPDAQRWAANPDLQAKLTAAQKRLFLASFGDSAQHASTVAGAINRLAQTPNFSQAVPTAQAMGELHAAVAANPAVEEPAKQLLQTPFMQAPRANTATKADFMRFGLQQASKGNDLQAVKAAGDMLGVLARNVPGRAQQRAMAMVRRDPSNTEGMKNVDNFVRQPTVQKLPIMARGTATEALTKGNGNAPVAEGLEQVAQALTTGEVADPSNQMPPKPTPAAKKMSREMKARLFATIASGRPSELRGISDKTLVALQSSAFPTRPNQVKRFMTALQARINSSPQNTAENIDPDQLLLHSKAGPLPKVPALRSTMGLSDEDAGMVRAQNRALVMQYYQKVTRSYAGVSDKLSGGEYLEDVRTLPNLREADKIDLSHLSREDAADLHPLLQSKGKQVQGTFQKLKVAQQKRMRELRGKRMPKAERMKRAAERRNVGMQPRYFNVSSLRQGRNAPSLPMPGQGVGKPVGKMGAQTVRMPVPNRGMAPGNDGMMASAPNPQMRAMGGSQGRAMPIPASQGGGGGATADAMTAHIMSQVDRSQPFEAQMAQMQQVIAQTLQQHMAVAQAQIMAATQKAMQSLMGDNAPLLPQEPVQQAPHRPQGLAGQQRSQSPMPLQQQAGPRSQAMPSPMGQQDLELPSQEPAPALPMGMQGQVAAAPQRRSSGGGEAEFLRAPGAPPANPSGPAPGNAPGAVPMNASGMAPMNAPGGAPAGDHAAQMLAQQALAGSGQLPPNGQQIPGARGNNAQPGFQPQGFAMAEAAAQAPHQAGTVQAPNAPQGQGFGQPAPRDGTGSEPFNPAATAPLVGAPTSLGAVEAVGQQRSQGLANLFAAANAQGATPAAPGQPMQQPQFAAAPQAGQPHQNVATQGAPQAGQPQGFAQQAQSGAPPAGQPHQGFAQQGAPQAGQPHQGFAQQGAPQAGQPHQGFAQQGTPQAGQPPQSFAQQSAPPAGQPQAPAPHGQGPQSAAGAQSQQQFAQPGQQAAVVAKSPSPAPTTGLSAAALAQAAAQGTLHPNPALHPNPSAGVGVNPQAGWAAPSAVGIGGNSSGGFGQPSGTSPSGARSADAHAAPHTNAAAQEQAVAAAGGGLAGAPLPQTAPPMGGPKSLAAVEAVGARPQGQGAANQVAAYRQSTEAASSANGGGMKLDLATAPRDSDGIPHAMRCPISLQVMERPVKASDGQIYDRSSIERWMQASPNPTSPLTRQPLTAQLEPQDALQQQIHAFVGSDPAVHAKLSPAQRQAVMAAVNEGIPQTHAMLRMFNSSQSTNAPVPNLLQEIRQPAPPPAAINPSASVGHAAAAAPNVLKAKQGVAPVASLDAPPDLPSANEAAPIAAPRQTGPVQGKTDGWGIQRTFERDLGGANRAPVRPAAQNREITNPFFQSEPSYAELDQEKYKGRSVVKPSSRRRDLQTLYNTPWRQMTAAEQAPFKNLDWNHTTWDAKFSASAKWPSSMRTRFANLSSIKRESVRSLGFTAEEWDAYVAGIDGGGGSSQGNPNQGRR